MSGIIYDLTGMRFGKLVVIGLSERRYKSNRGVHWKCLCDCGNEKTIISTSLRSGRTKSCGSNICANRWQGYGEIPLGYWSHLKDSANKRKHDFFITIEEAWDLFLKQERKCALSGLPLCFYNNPKKIEQTASIDRINNSIGYITENIQWVHKDVNWMKQDFDENYFVSLCKFIATCSE